jgi:hypothetical protein
MHVVGRRWSVLRWVRRVRLSFVLSKRALECARSISPPALHEICDGKAHAVPGASEWADRFARIMMRTLADTPCLRDGACGKDYVNDVRWHGTH